MQRRTERAPAKVNILPLMPGCACCDLMFIEKRPFMQTQFTRFASLAFSALALTATVTSTLALADESQLQPTATESIPGDSAELVVVIIQGDSIDKTSTPLPARVTITDSAKQHPDGSGRGAYSDGRFFVEGRFAVQLPPGNAKLQIASGPHIVPIDTTVTAESGKRIQFVAHMQDMLRRTLRNDS